MGAPKLKKEIPPVTTTDLDFVFFSLRTVATKSGKSLRTVQRDAIEGILKASRQEGGRRRPYYVSLRNYLLYMGITNYMGVNINEENVPPKHKPKRQRA